MNQKSLLREFTKYVGLNILGMIGMSCYILADTFFVSKALGADGLTALNFCISVFSILQGFGLMLGIGGATRYSIEKASGNRRKGDEVFTVTVVLGLVLAVIFVVVGLFYSAAVATRLGADEQTLPLAKVYLTTILSFAPFFLMNNILLAFIRNDHSPNLSMTAMLISSLSNIILDYVFIFPCGLGMFGAAFATGLSPIISISILSLHFVKKRHGFRLCKYNGLWSEKIKKAADILVLGLSSFIGEMSSAIALITFNLVILRMEGNIGVAAYGIVANIALIAVAVFTGAAQGLQPLVSKCYGEGRAREGAKLYSYAVMTALGLSIVMYAVIFTGRVPIAAVFNKDQDVVLSKLAVNGLGIYFIGFFFAGINIVTAAYFSASERAKEAFAVSCARSLIILVPALLFMSRALGMNGVWWAFVVTEMLVCAFSVWKVRDSGTFKR